MRLCTVFDFYSCRTTHLTDCIDSRIPHIKVVFLCFQTHATRALARTAGRALFAPLEGTRARAKTDSVACPARSTHHARTTHGFVRIHGVCGGSDGGIPSVDREAISLLFHSSDGMTKSSVCAFRNCKLCFHVCLTAVSVRISLCPRRSFGRILHRSRL